MQIEYIRKGSRGIDGTYENIDCHAKSARPFVDYLVKLIPSLPFVKWKQGHNVHTLEREDGFTVEFRPFLNKCKNQYGIEIRHRVSRSNRPIIYQFTDMGQAPVVAALLTGIGSPVGSNYYGSSEQ